MFLLNYDIKVLEWLNHHRIKWLDPFFIFITDTAYITAVAVIVIIFIYSLYKKERSLKFKTLQMVMAMLLNTIIITILKYSINRTRPFVNDVSIEKLSAGGSPSFPSGHTADAFVIATSVTLLFTKQKWLVALIWLWAITVAYTRIALGVHYPSDVLGSFFFGAGSAIAIHKLRYLKKNISYENRHIQ